MRRLSWWLALSLWRVPYRPPGVLVEHTLEMPPQRGIVALFMEVK